MYQGSSSSRSSSSRLGSSRTYEQGEKYMQTLEMRSKKLNAHTRHNLSSLPKLYAKAEELNRKLAASSMLLNYSNSLDGDCRRSSAATPTHHDSSSLDDFDQHNGSHRDITSRSGSRKDSEIYLKEHKKAVLKKTLVVSQCLDQDVKSRLEHIKYGSVSSLGAYALNGNHHNTFGSIPNENLMNGSINSGRVAAAAAAAAAATSEANSRRYSMIDVNYIKKSPREEREDSVVDNDDVISNSENDNDLFSGSSELQMNNRDEVAPLRRSSRSRLGDFASNLSKEGQYALLRSLEDTLVNEIEMNRPDLAEKLPALKSRGDPQHPRRTSLNLEQMQKRNAMILQQIETVTELLDELRDYEKKKPSERPAKKQIHFSDSSDTHNERLDSFSSEASGKSSSSAFKSALKNEPLNILPSRRQRKSIMSNCSLPEAEVSSLVAVDKVTHLLSKYIYLKKHLE